jgi:hypothetical protein
MLGILRGVNVLGVDSVADPCTRLLYQNFIS